MEVYKNRKMLFLKLYTADNICRPALKTMSITKADKYECIICILKPLGRVYNG